MRVAYADVPARTSCVTHKEVKCCTKNPPQLVGDVPLTLLMPVMSLHHFSAAQTSLERWATFAFFPTWEQHILIWVLQHTSCTSVHSREPSGFLCFHLQLYFACSLCSILLKLIGTSQDVAMAQPWKLNACNNHAVNVCFIFNNKF